MYTVLLLWLWRCGYRLAVFIEICIVGVGLEKEGLTWLNVVTIHSYALTAPPAAFFHPALSWASLLALYIFDPSIFTVLFNHVRPSHSPPRICSLEFVHKIDQNILTTIFWPCHFVHDILSTTFCPWHFVHDILSTTFCPLHFVRDILSVTFCPMTFCPHNILSATFCPWHFVRWHFVR